MTLAPERQLAGWWFNTSTGYYTVIDDPANATCQVRLQYQAQRIPAEIPRLCVMHAAKAVYAVGCGPNAPGERAGPAALHSTVWTET